MADWDVDSPSDSDFIAQYPANERAARAALVANFGVDHEANAQDANIGKHVKVSLVDQSSDPAGAAGSSTLYAKEASGASQLFWRSDTGAVVQLTAAGGLRAESLVGTLPDARLSANIPRKDAANAFQASGSNTFTSTSTFVPLHIRHAGGANVRFGLTALGADENERTWVFRLQGDTLRVSTAVDDNPVTVGDGRDAIIIARDGFEISEVELNATTLDFNGSVDVSEVVTVSNGSAAAPAYSFSGDTDLGIYRVGANNLGITAGNSAVAQFSQTEIDLTATTLDFNGDADISGTLEVGGAVRAGTAATSTSSTLAAGQIHHRSSNTTIPSMSAGQWVAVQNTGTSSITLSQGSGVALELAGTTTTGNRTLAAKGFAFIYFRANGVGVCGGAGVS